MADYRQIQTHCSRNQGLSAKVIDDFLIYFAAHQNKLDREFDKRLAPYSHVTRELPEEWLNRSKAQYIAHRVFKKGGLINRYIRHSALSHLTAEEMEFLEYQKAHPWRFSFAEIIGRPERDFFQMEDVFAGESYLLYSPSMTDIVDVQRPVLWLNMIAFNGECMQTYGPICAFNAFEQGDILFFASQLTRRGWIEDGRELLVHLEQNPVPYSLLFSGSNIPMTFHGDDQIVQITAEYLDDAFDSFDFSEDFSIGYNQGVYRLAPEGWSAFPHFSTAYYDEKEELLSLYAMTDRGFRKLVDLLNRSGYDLSYEPDIRINMAMLSTARDILKKDIELNRYEHLFSEETPKSETDDRQLDKLNALLSELIPLLNNRQKPDLDALAAKHGVDPGTVHELYEQVRKKMGD